jgi:molybdate transport system substrate-binding protein
MVVLLAATACGGASAPGSTGDERPGPVTVFAAASLTEAFTDVRGALGADGLDVTYSFAGSGALVQQVRQGAPADVVATADAASMQSLVDAGLVDAPVTFARNQLEILVAPGNPKRVTALVDLARDDITFVTEDDSVPAGRYATAALAAAGVDTHPASREASVKAAVAKVTSGEADATIAYVTDVQAAGAKGAGVAIPPDQNQVANYPIAVVKASAHRAAATAFVEAVVHEPGQAALRARGFLAP